MTMKTLAIIVLMLSHGVCFALGALYAYLDVRREIRRFRRFYCQSEIEGRLKCTMQCSHCKAYFTFKATTK